MLVVGAVLLAPLFFLNLDSAAGLAVAGAGLLMLMTALVLWKQAADRERNRRRDLLADVGGEADVAPENGALPRRDPFEDGDG